MIQYICDFLGINPAQNTLVYELVVSACLFVFVSVASTIIRYITLPIELLVARYKSK